MTAQDATIIIGAITAGIVAIIGAVALAYRQAAAANDAAQKAREATAANREEILVVGDRVIEVGKQLDGRLSQLLIEARTAARAEGVAAGEQSQRDRAAPSDTP